LNLGYRIQQPIPKLQIPIFSRLFIADKKCLNENIFFNYKTNFDTLFDSFKRNVKKFENISSLNNNTWQEKNP
jgi:hypothetical protein